MRDHVMLPEVACRLPLVEAEAVEAGVIAGRLGIPETLAVKALARLIHLQCARASGGEYGRKYWGLNGVDVLVEPVRMETTGLDDGPRVNASGRSRGSGFASFGPRDPNEKRMRLTDVQLIFKHAVARGRKYFLQASEESEAFARRNGGTNDARLIAFRIQQLAFEEALQAVGYRIESLHKAQAAASAQSKKQATA